MCVCVRGGGPRCTTLRHTHLQLAELATRDAGFEAVLKVRTSVGLKVAAYAGNFTERAEAEADVGALDAETGLVATLAHDGNEIKEGEELFVQVRRRIGERQACRRASNPPAPPGAPQVAALVTHTTGQRRVRVHNLRLVATDNVAAVFRHADMDTVLGVLLRNGACLAPGWGSSLPGPLSIPTLPCSRRPPPAGVQTTLTKDARAALSDMTDAAIDMLHAYRKFCAAASSPGQLILPDSLKLLPLYLSTIGKLAAFGVNRPAEKTAAAAAGKPAAAGGRASAFGDVVVRADARAAQMIALSGMSACRVVPFIYPRLFLLHTLGGLVSHRARVRVWGSL